MTLRDLIRIWELATSVIDRDKEDQLAVLALARKIQQIDPMGRYVEETHRSWKENPFQ